MPKGRISVAKVAPVHLDLGCGERKNEGFLGVDSRDLAGVDVVHDLEVYPWPFPDECADMVVASHFMEHIDPRKSGMLRFMDEVWRVMIPDGNFLASTPYAGSRSYYADPTHINPINELTWSYFDPLDSLTNGSAYRVYRPKPWKIEHLTWNEEGLLEVNLVKRLEDASYGQ